MNSPSDILVITTDSPSEGEIVKHLKPVSSHIVAGTNLFSDFFGGMSDIFGGRSQSYQTQLTSIYNEAIEKVKRKAYKIGGNCVVGLKIDIDEISGKGKSMFMITAIGTAVIIKSGKGVQANLENKQGFIGREEIDQSKRLRYLIDQAETKQLELNLDNWEFIIQYSVSEVYPEVIRQYKISLHYPEETRKKFRENVEAYLSALRTEEKEKLIYNSFKKEGRVMMGFLKEIIKEYSLLNLDKCMELLCNEDIEVKKAGLIISSFDKPFYSEKDIEDYQRIIQLINENFKEKATIESKTTLLSSKEKQVWICECGKSNKSEDIYCSRCSKDSYGFTSNESNPLEVVEFINRKLSLIEEIRASKNNY